MFERIKQWLQNKLELWIIHKAFDYLYWVAVNCRDENDHTQIVNTLDILRNYMDKD